MTERPNDPAEIDEIVRAVTESPKYRHVCPDFVRRLGIAEGGKGRSGKEAVKAVKKRLHQVAGAFLDGGRDFSGWLKGLILASGTMAGLRKACVPILKRHASTRERLGILDRFFVELFEDIGPVKSVLDLACGFNPLCIPWMPLPEDAEYVALDIHNDLELLLGEFFELIPVRGRYAVRDVVHHPPAETCDAALLLKTLPCIERIDRDAGPRLLDALRAKHIFVSFPVSSLGGRRKGMPRAYEDRFRSIVSGKPWEIRKFEFPTELVFRIDKSPTMPTVF